MSSAADERPAGLRRALEARRDIELAAARAEVARAAEALDAARAEAGLREQPAVTDAPPSWWQPWMPHWHDREAIDRMLAGRMVIVLSACCRSWVCNADTWNRPIRLWRAIDAQTTGEPVRAPHPAQTDRLSVEELRDLPPCPRCGRALELRAKDLRRLKPGDDSLRAYRRRTALG